MLSTGLKIGSALLCLAAIPAISGCAHSRAKTRTGRATLSLKYKHVTEELRRFREQGGIVNRAKRKHNTPFASAGDMPPNAKSGECYARVYLPPVFETVTERVYIREESEKIEIIPAKYNWTEERVLVKEASTQLVEVPAQFYVQDHIVQTNPGHTTWIKADADRCVADTPGPTRPEIFCCVSEQPTTTTIQTERLMKGPMIKEVTVPAEYQTIRTQKLVRPASMRKVTVPAEFREIKKTVMVAPGRMVWYPVDCDTMNRKVRRVSDRNP